MGTGSRRGQILLELILATALLLGFLAIAVQMTEATSRRFDAKRFKKQGLADENKMARKNKNRP